MKKIVMRFREGAASFYVVAFATLVFVIIAVSFAAVVVAEMVRTSNADLSQSAYDSALAGIEDAKLAFYNYQMCKEQGNFAIEPTGDGPVTCSEIIWYMENPDCDMVAHILGRIGKNESNKAVTIQETKEGDNSMQQSYTCVTIASKLNDYRSTLTEANPTHVIRVKLDDIEADKIKSVKLSWSLIKDGAELAFTNISDRTVQFPSDRIATPPTISLGLVQTAERFKLDQFDRVKENATNRGTIFLVPTNSATRASESNAPDNYIGVYDDAKGINKVSAAQIVKSNDRTVKNVPYAVYCPEGETTEFVCSTIVELPGVIDGNRSEETFIFVVSIPYGQPSTDFALEFYCDEGVVCGETTIGGEAISSSQAVLEGVQVKIDSTGRSNDLYRRVEARLDVGDASFPYPLYALELLDENGFVLKKDLIVTRERYKSKELDGEYRPNLDSLRARQD